MYPALNQKKLISSFLFSQHNDVFWGKSFQKIFKIQNFKNVDQKGNTKFSQKNMETKSGQPQMQM
ncbi:MAG: hypothetical protein CM15mP83_2530 [Flavobacteriaceae bacterium]|nr:MAG: hypothetical protein CM15mP83_2530 [Flavobacteriaceae bacterium]